MKATFETVVPLPPEQAFAFAADPSNWPKFFLQMESVETSEDWRRVGGHARVTNRILGSTMALDMELTEWDPPHRLRYTARESGSPDQDHLRVFEPVPGGTRMTGTATGTPRGGLTGLVDRMKFHVMRRIYAKAMARLPEVARGNVVT